MKKRTLCIIAFIAIVGTASWNYQQNEEKAELSDLALENIEVLAREENDGGKYKYVFPGSDPSVKCVCSGTGIKSCC